jgi:hypothetical protein
VSNLHFFSWSPIDFHNIFVLILILTHPTAERLIRFCLALWAVYEAAPALVRECCGSGTAILITRAKITLISDYFVKENMHFCWSKIKIVLILLFLTNKKCFLKFLTKLHYHNLNGDIQHRPVKILTWFQTHRIQKLNFYDRDPAISSGSLRSLFYNTKSYASTSTYSSNKSTVYACRYGTMQVTVQQPILHNLTVILLHDTAGLSIYLLIKHHSTTVISK